MSSILTPSEAYRVQDSKTYNEHVQNSCYNTSNDQKVTVEKMKDAYFLASDLFVATLLE